ncbi:DinB family protein [Mucilaginibacter sp.]|uniref:DinB family protein n=1 Tax=Mucilaginibacter sp. TaxID=1882438 RepID=UPI003D0A5061
MKAHFTKLINFDHYANKRIIDTIIKAGEPIKALRLMGHLLAAQQIWLSRCKSQPPTGTVLWPDLPVSVLTDLADQNHQNWSTYLDGLQPADFYKVISYKNMKGDNFENKLSDILTHVINHGTHHRAQAGQQLKLNGFEDLPNTDYIFYLR